jgi:Protein of unknown function (DUF3105)
MGRVAKKARTPTPPRRVQAPKTRSSTPVRRDLEARNRTILYAAGASGLLGLAIVLIVFAFAGGSKANVASVSAAVEKVGGTFKTFPAQPRTPHYTTLPPKNPLKYNSFPPTSGRHYFQWVIWGYYTEPVNLYQEVHNLEHGGVIIQWGSKVSASDVEKIHQFWREDPNAMLAAPLPKLGNKIALTSWTHLAEFTKFDEGAFKKFRDVLRYHGPESPLLSKSDLAPGK